VHQPSVSSQPGKISKHIKQLLGFFIPAAQVFDDKAKAATAAAVAKKKKF
jgi:hypothetical protein